LVDEAAVVVLGLGDDMREVNFKQGAMEITAVAAAPIAAADEPTNFLAREMYLAANRATVVGMFFQKCNKNLMGERSRLTEARIGTNNNIFLNGSLVDDDFLRVR